MFGLYFGDLVSGINTVFVLGMLVFVVMSIKNRSRISKWGRRIALFIVVGTAISALSATRDAFMMPNALFELNSMQTLVCSIAGGAIFLTGIVSIFLKSQNAKRICFYIAAALFIVQVIVIEASRIAGVM